MEFNPPPQTRYGHCDSYFVVSDEEEFNVVAERKREQTRSIARAHQRQLGLELSKITADEYQEDILDHMEFMEVRRNLLRDTAFANNDSPKPCRM